MTILSPNVDVHACCVSPSCKHATRISILMLSWSKGRTDRSIQTSTWNHENYDQQKPSTQAVRKSSSHHCHLKRSISFVATVLSFGLHAGSFHFNQNGAGLEIKTRELLYYSRENSSSHRKIIQPEGKFGTSKSPEIIQIYFFSGYNSLAFQHSGFCHTSVVSILSSHFFLKHWLLF